MKENISLICSRSPKERIPLLINILYLYGIRQKKEVYMQTFLFHTSYYINRLVSYISKIDFKLVASYMFPVGSTSKALKAQKINSSALTKALEEIRQSNIVISESKIFAEQDWVDYIFDFDIKYQVIIIDSFEDLLKNTTKSLQEIKARIENYAQKYKTEIILFMDEKEAAKYKFTNWKVCHVDSPFTFTYAKTNNHLIDINLKEEER